MSLNNHRIIFIIFLSALAAFAPFSTDIYLASMPTIQREMHASMAQVQLTLSLFFVGFALAQLFWGPLSDRVGRKKTIVIGVSVYVLGSLLCIVSISIFMLIMARLIQAIGACVGIVMVMAIVKDSFAESKTMAKVIGMLMAIAMFAPMIAPVIGSYLLVHFGWRANFYVLLFYGVILLVSVLFLHETHPEVNRKPLPLTKLLHAYYEQLTHRSFLVSALASSTNFCVLFAFISSASFIYIDIYHLPEKLFGYFFSGNAVVLVLGNVTSHRLKQFFYQSKMIFIALFLILFGAILMWFSIYVFPGSIWSVVLPLLLISYSVGILYPELMSYPLDNVVAYTGIASSLVGAMRFSLASLIGIVMGFVISHSAWPLAVIIMLLNLLTLILMKTYFSLQKN